MSQVHPHVLIGTSTVPGAFTRDIIEEMSRHVDRPIIFPLSNPTRLHEAQPADLYKWTAGRCLVATGSPFPAVEYGGRKYEVAECNNAMVFPGIGLGCILSRARLLSDAMLVSAVTALADLAPLVVNDERAAEKDHVVPGLLPDVAHVREVSVRVATAVVRTALHEGLARVPDIPGQDERELEDWVRAQMWEPVYREFMRD